MVNQEFGLGQTALVISPRALKVLFSLSLLGLSTSCSTQKVSRNFSKSCSKDNQKLMFVRNVARKKKFFFGLMLKYAIHFLKSGSVGGQLKKRSGRVHLPRDRANRGNFSLFNKHVTRFPV